VKFGEGIIYRPYRGRFQATMTLFADQRL